MIYDPARANPLFGNPLKTRDDVAKAVTDLFEPLLPYFLRRRRPCAPRRGRRDFDRAAADLEGFARPLWGIVPLVAGGGAFRRIGHSTAAGWPMAPIPLIPNIGAINCRPHQRMVELAAVGFALALVPEHIWEPLDDSEKKTIWLPTSQSARAGIHRQ